MKNLKNKKGFTIVELVIVIAVIAILAAVLIPTFSNVIEKADKSAVQQGAANVYKELLAADLSDGELDGDDKTDDTINFSQTASDENGNIAYSYTVADDVVTFTYTAKGYTATLEEDGSWTLDPVA